jgi:lipopolysaccharide biosynthesis regulator YciM
MKNQMEGMMSRDGLGVEKEVIPVCSDEEREKVLSEVSHDIRNVVSTVRAEAQLGLIKYEKNGNIERMVEALTNIIAQTDSLVSILDEKLARCRTKSSR